MCRTGCEIWTDEGGGYDWLDATEDYVHYGMNHNKGEGVKAGGQGSNPIESLFSRLRKYLRKDNLRSKNTLKTTG